MSVINSYPLTHASVLSIFADKDLIKMDPEYQRQGEIWSKEKRQLLIDSIINRYDIPKLYFHKLSSETAKKTSLEYAVIDGRQRLEAIFSFINGDFALSDEFEYLEDPTVNAAGLTYNDLAKKFPRLKQRFDAFTLPIVCVETDELELIEEMFSRLNEAVPLNAAEKRNAFGGEMAAAFRDLSSHAFFGKKVRVSNRRYQHREIAARLLFLEHCVARKKLVDTKKPFLDQFTKEFRSGKKEKINKLKEAVGEILKDMFAVFTAKDSLLSSQSSIPIYFLVFREAKSAGVLPKISRSKLVSFDRRREKNRRIAERDIAKANFEFLEYDRLSQQGTNDASSIRERVRILREFLGV